MGKMSFKGAAKAIQTAVPAAPQGVQRPGENGFKYKPKFGLVVVCRDEPHQQSLFERLTGLGLKVKVVSV